MLARVRSAISNNRVVSWIKNHKRISLVLLVILIIVIIIFRPKGPPPLETVVVKEGNITESLTASGAVAAENSVNLSFLAPGKITYVGVAEGDEVKKGQTIAIVDQRSAQKNMENALRDYSKQRNTFEQAKDDNGEKTPQTAADESVRRVLENNQFDLEKSVASVELQEIVKQNSVLTSPLNGVVLRADVTTPGVNASATTTYTIADPDSLHFAIDADEADIGKVELGQPVKIFLEAYPEQEIGGNVESIAFSSHKTDTGGNAFTVKVKLSPMSGVLYRIGMNGDAEIILDERKNVVTLPLAALVDESYVYVKNPDGKFEKRTVKLGIQSETDVEITSGLTVGEEVTLQPEEAAKSEPR